MLAFALWNVVHFAPSHFLDRFSLRLGLFFPSLFLFVFILRRYSIRSRLFPSFDFLFSRLCIHCALCLALWLARCRSCAEVFLNNVHRAAPTTFYTKWSALRGANGLLFANVIWRAWQIYLFSNVSICTQCENGVCTDYGWGAVFM